MLTILAAAAAAVVGIAFAVYVFSLGPFGRPRLYRRRPYEAPYRNPNRRRFSNRTPRRE